MITRRTLLGWVVSSPVALAIGRGVAHAAPRAGQLVDQRGARLAGRGLGVFSISNANDRYVAVAELAVVPKDAPSLVLKRRRVSAESWGTGFGEAGASKGSASFRADRALADEIARLWKLTRKDRAPLGAGLVGTWKPETQPWKLGGEMKLVLEITNTGADPVGFSIGGRQRGARDNRFELVAARKGVDLPVIDAPDFGGIGYIQALKPGASHTLSADLRSWATLDAPGAYRVRCAHHVELTPGTESASWPDRGHLTWDHAFADTIDVVVA